MSIAQGTMLQEPLSDDARARWESAIRRERYRWHNVGACTVCGEWVGHFGGSTTRDPCACIPDNVPLEEVRPNCYTVLRHWIGDAIRAACTS